jgi:hypothetical protein
MEKKNETRQVYIVISQTGTVLSRILKRITGAEYNHASISLSGDLRTMYSFGRMNPYNPFWGGFVMESPYSGTFRRFSETKAVVLVVDIREEQYRALSRTLEEMWAKRRLYRYNFIGIVLAYFQIKRKRANCFYCSEFVGEILLQGGVDGMEQLASTIVQPIHFLSLPHTQVYSGKLREYVYRGECSGTVNPA